MTFTIYDIALLIIFVISISLFLYVKRKNLKRDGLLFLYRTKWGVRLISHIGKKYKRSLKVIGYISIGAGYLLMAGVIYLFYLISKIYFSRPDIVTQIKVPPIMPLIPYIDKIVPGLPPFYFTYWIIILAIIAIAHEFAHGIFAARDKIKIKSTGFGFFPFFLPIFLAAFVELDEKKMAKKPKLSQMAILSSGTFANILTAILSFILIWVFFSLAFAPSGVIFDTYAYSIVGVSSISSVNGVYLSNTTYDKVLNLSKEDGLNKIGIGNWSYLADKDFLEKQKNNQLGILLVYNDAPAINAGISPGEAITEINDVKVHNKDELARELLRYKPGTEVNIKTKKDKELLNYKVTLGEHPEKKAVSFLGVGFSRDERTGIIGKTYVVLSSFKDPNVYYESIMGEFGDFVYYLLWWLILISISIALINMLPVGIFDGGRFFYLTVLAMIKDEKKAKRCFTIVTYLFLALVLLLLIFWVLSFF